MIFGLSGGGTSLNFKVLGYATKDELLAAKPAKNTIGVITDIPIASWMFDSAEPSPAAEGMVWFPVGTASAVTFNALKKNDIEVCPLSVKQYVDGSWEDKTALSYQNGEWREWHLYIYDNGVNAAKFVSSGSGGSVAFNEDHIKISVTQTKSAVGQWACTEHVLDLTPFTTLVVKMSGSTSYGGMTGFGVAPTKPSGTAPSTSAYTSVKTKTEQEAYDGVYTCDISNVDGGYVFFGSAKSATGVVAGGGSALLYYCYLY